MADVIYFRGGREEARRVIRSFISILTGSEPDKFGLAKGVFYSLGFAALSDIQADYIRKARGGVGEDGSQWPPLDPKTIAYSRRFGAGEQAALKKANGLGAANRHGIGGNTGLLTKQQQTRWNKLYSGALKWLAAREPLEVAKGHAAAIAWKKLKEEGAKTKLEVYGNRQVEILRDTGVLFNSLSPGRMEGGAADASYTPPPGDGGDQQIFQSLSNGIIVGTNVPYAKVHQEGYAAKGIPARPIVPKEAPLVWLERWATIGMLAISVAMKRRFSIGGGV